MRPFLLTLALTGLSFAQHAGHTPVTPSKTTPAKPASTPAKPAAKPTAAPTTDAHDGTWSTHGLERLRGPAFDRAYLSMMVAHHQAALDMSAAALPRVRDPQIKAWTEEVLYTQQSEIREMNAMFVDFKLGGVDAARRDAMTRAMRPMVAAVKASKNAESAWVEHMMPHHAAGVVMATLALTQSDNALVRQHAAAVVRVQAQQMYDYRMWSPRD